MLYLQMAMNYAWDRVSFLKSICVYVHIFINTFVLAKSNYLNILIFPYGSIMVCMLQIINNETESSI
eukprot:Pgem_evm1s6690